MNRLLLTTTLLLLALGTWAQPNIGGRPLGLSPEFQNWYGDLPLFALEVPALDLEQIHKEDVAMPDDRRFTAPVQVDWGLSNTGEWTDLPNGARLWRLQLEAVETTQALAVLYDDFFLPKGAKFYMYSPEGKQIIGGYTHRNNPQTGRFMTGLIQGRTAILEYYEPADAIGKGRIHIFRIDQAYPKAGRPASDYPFQVHSGGGNDLGFGTSLDCHVNVNCPEGTDWEKQKRSTCRIIMALEEGFGYCTGTLINNTNNDGTPFVLSANHCFGNFTPLYDMWRFDFNYETNGCTNPTEEPAFQSVLGCSLRARREQSDLLLLEAFEPIPEDYNVYFAGWNRSANAPANSAHVHHPRGDIKKISLDEQPAEIFASTIFWNNDITTPENHHFKVVYDVGTHEIGSSGGGLFDENGRLIGQLHGGFTDCNLFIAYFGRFNLSWTGGGSPATSLQSWLDPGQTGAMTLDGIENPSSNATAVLSGKIALADGRGLSNATVSLVGENKTAVTDLAGNFLFEAMPVGKTYTLLPSKTGGFENGVSTFDLVIIQKHILQIEEFDNAYALLAADVNSSASVSTFDLVELRKFILELITTFPNDTPSWLFIPASHDFSGFNLDSFDFVFPEEAIVEGLVEDTTVDFTAVKVGDLNGSVSPDE